MKKSTTILALMVAAAILLAVLAGNIAKAEPYFGG